MYSSSADASTSCLASFHIRVLEPSLTTLTVYTISAENQNINASASSQVVSSINVQFKISLAPGILHLKDLGSGVIRATIIPLLSRLRIYMSRDLRSLSFHVPTA